MSRQRWIFLICIVSAQIILSEQVVAQSRGINNNSSDIWISNITENHRSNNNKQQQTYKMQHSLSCVSGDQHHGLISWIRLSWIVISNDLLVLVYDCPDWGQGYEVTFVTVPGMDEWWCQHLSNVWYTLDRNPNMPVSQCDPSPHCSNVLPHPARAARHPSVGLFIWTMFTGQWPSLSGIKSGFEFVQTWWMKHVLAGHWGNDLFVSITKLKSSAGEARRLMGCRFWSRRKC